MSYVFPAAQCDLELSLQEKAMLNAVTYIGISKSVQIVFVLLIFGSRNDLQRFPLGNPRRQLGQEEASSYGLTSGQLFHHLERFLAKLLDAVNCKVSRWFRVSVR